MYQETLDIEEKVDLTYFLNFLHIIVFFRQPISFLLQLFFPVILISVLLLLKLAIPEGNHDICQVSILKNPKTNSCCLLKFRARATPSTGLLTSFQSYLCNIQNDCHDFEDFEVSTYDENIFVIECKHF